MVRKPGMDLGFCSQQAPASFEFWKVCICVCKEQARRLLFAHIAARRRVGDADVRGVGRRHLTSRAMPDAAALWCCKDFCSTTKCNMCRLVCEMEVGWVWRRAAGAGRAGEGLPGSRHRDGTRARKRAAHAQACAGCARIAAIPPLFVKPFIE